MQRIVPTSSCDSGDSSLPIFSILSDSEPVFRADLPLNTLTSTSSPLRMARPTSSLASTGSPIRMALESLAGTKRTRRLKDILASLVRVLASIGIEGRRSRVVEQQTSLDTTADVAGWMLSRNSSSPAHEIRNFRQTLLPSPPTRGTGGEGTLCSIGQIHPDDRDRTNRSVLDRYTEHHIENELY
jgi:hypothetical protein